MVEENNVVVLHVGMFDKDTKKQELSDDVFVTTIGSYMDCTMTKCTGIYTHHDGTKVIEPSLKIEVYNRQFNELHKVVKRLCKELNQESIVMSCGSRVEFVEAV